jgi:hypothetical protein
LIPSIALTEIPVMFATSSVEKPLSNKAVAVANWNIAIRFAGICYKIRHWIALPYSRLKLFCAGESQP